jgi:hypothetical protein
MVKEDKGNNDYQKASKKSCLRKPAFLSRNRSDLSLMN